MCVQAPLCAHLGTKGNAKHPLSVSTLPVLSLDMKLSIFFYAGWSVNSKNLSTCLFPIHCWGYKHVWSRQPYMVAVDLNLGLSPSSPPYCVLPLCVRTHSFSLLGCFLLFPW